MEIVYPNRPMEARVNDRGMFLMPKIFQDPDAKYCIIPGPTLRLAKTTELAEMRQQLRGPIDLIYRKILFDMLEASEEVPARRNILFLPEIVRNEFSNSYIAIRQIPYKEIYEIKLSRPVPDEERRDLKRAKLKEKKSTDSQEVRVMAFETT